MKNKLSCKGHFVLFACGLCLFLVTGFYMDILPLMKKRRSAMAVAAHVQNKPYAFALVRKSEDMSFFVLQSAQAAGLTLEEIEPLENHEECKRVRLTCSGCFKQVIHWVFTLYDALPILIEDFNLSVDTHACKMSLILTYLNYSYVHRVTHHYSLLNDPFIHPVNDESFCLQDELPALMLETNHSIQNAKHQGYFCIDKVCWDFFQLFNSDSLAILRK